MQGLTKCGGGGGCSAEYPPGRGFVEGAGHCKSLLFMSKRLTHKNHQPNPSYLFSYIRRAPRYHLVLDALVATCECGYVHIRSRPLSPNPSTLPSVVLVASSFPRPLAKSKK